MGNKSKFGLAGLALSGILGGSSGCHNDYLYQTGQMTPEQSRRHKEALERRRNIGMGLAFGGAKSRAVNQGRPDIAAGIDTVSNLEAAARQGTDINLKQDFNYGQKKMQNYGDGLNKSNSSSFGESQNIIFACRGYEGDKNGNGIMDYPFEFKDIRRSFFTGEEVSVYARVDIDFPHHVSCELLTSRGEIVGEGYVSRKGVSDGEPEFLGVKFATGRADPGMYTARVYVDGNLWGQTKFSLKVGKITVDVDPR